MTWGRVRPRVGVVRTVVAASMCFAYSCTLQLHGALEYLVAKHTAIVAGILHRMRVGEDARARNIVFWG